MAIVVAYVVLSKKLKASDTMQIKQLQILPYHAILKDMTGLQVKNSAEQ